MRIIKNRAIVSDQWRLEAGDGDGAGAGDVVVDGDGAGVVDADVDGVDTVDDAGDGDVVDGADAPRVILSLESYLQARDELHRHGHPIGVKLQPADEVDTIAADLNRIDLIALAFGAFNEGRGYSQAVQLRQLNFTGEIRALGAHRDNLPLMERCGIDAYQLAPGEDIDDALNAFDEITEYYALNG